MNEEVYIHGVGHFEDYKTQKIILNKILSCGEILSLRNRNIDISCGFNGLDYISLCDYQKSKTINSGDYFDYNAYKLFVKNHLSFAFSKDSILAVKPILLDYRLSKIDAFRQNLTSKRFSDLPDEIMVKDRISLDNMCYIGFPFEYYLNTIANHKINLVLKEIEYIKLLSNSYGYNTDIYDIDSKILLNEDNIMKLKK